MRAETKPAGLILVAWFCVALLVGLTGIFNSASAGAVALTVWALTAFVLVSWWKVPGVKRWMGATDLRWLIGLHLIRFIGIYFIVMCQSGELSCAFAVPAGAGDIAVATGAGMLLFAGAVDRDWLKLIGIWNFLGLLDILMVVFRAYRVGVTDWPGMAPLRSLPLMLLPTFLVPLIIMSHIIIFVRLPGSARAAATDVRARPE
jgi:hypothetical protein